MSGAPLGANIPGFTFIKIRDAHDQDIPTWTCYDPTNGKENVRIPHDITDLSTYGWIICNGQEVVLKNGNKDKYCYTANPPLLRKIQNGTICVQRNTKVNISS